MTLEMSARKKQAGSGEGAEITVLRRSVTEEAIAATLANLRRASAADLNEKGDYDTARQTWHKAAQVYVETGNKESMISLVEEIEGKAGMHEREGHPWEAGVYLLDAATMLQQVSEGEKALRMVRRAVDIMLADARIAEDYVLDGRNPVSFDMFVANVSNAAKLRVTAAGGAAEIAGDREWGFAIVAELLDKLNGSGERQGYVKDRRFEGSVTSLAEVAYAIKQGREDDTPPAGGGAYL